MDPWSITGLGGAAEAALKELPAWTDNRVGAAISIGNVSRWGRIWCWFLAISYKTTPLGSPIARKAVSHPSAFCPASFSIRWVWLFAFIEEFGKLEVWEAEFGVCIQLLLLPEPSTSCVCSSGGKSRACIQLVSTEYPSPPRSISRREKQSPLLSRWERSAERHLLGLLLNVKLWGETLKDLLDNFMVWVLFFYICNYFVIIIYNVIF